MPHAGKARVLEKDEFQKVLKMAEMTRQAKRNIALLHMSFYLALRACEMRRLRIKDVLLPDGKTLTEEIILLKTMTKNKKPRIVYLTNKKCRKALEDYLTERMTKNKFEELDLTEPLFPSQKGGEFRSNTIVMLFRKIYDMCNLKNAKSHSGRRTWATMRSRSGYPIEYAQEVLGHEKIDTTRQYFDIDPKIVKKIMTKDIF